MVCAYAYAYAYRYLWLATIVSASRPPVGNTEYGQKLVRSSFCPFFGTVRSYAQAVSRPTQREIGYAYSISPKEDSFQLP